MEDIEELYNRLSEIDDTFQSRYNREQFSQKMSEQDYVNKLSDWSKTYAPELTSQITLLKKKDSTSQEVATATLQEEATSSEPARLEDRVSQWMPAPTKEEVQTQREQKLTLEDRVSQFIDSPTEEEIQTQIEQEDVLGQQAQEGLQFQEELRQKDRRERIDSALKMVSPPMETEDMTPIVGDDGKIFGWQENEEQEEESEEDKKKKKELGEWVVEQSNRWVRPEDEEIISFSESLSSKTSDNLLVSGVLIEGAQGAVNPKLNTKGSIDDFYSSSFRSLVNSLLPKEYSNESLFAARDLVTSKYDQAVRSRSPEDIKIFEEEKKKFEALVKERSVKQNEIIKNELSSLDSAQASYFSSPVNVAIIDPTRFTVEDPSVNDFQAKIISDYANSIKGNDVEQFSGDLKRNAEQSFNYFKDAFSFQGKMLNSIAKKERDEVYNSDLSDLEKEEKLKLIESGYSRDRYLLQQQTSVFFDRKFRNWQNKVLAEDKRLKEEAKEAEESQKIIDEIDKRARDGFWHGEGLEGLDRYSANLIHNNISIPVVKALSGLAGGVLSIARSVGLNAENIRALTGSPELSGVADAIYDFADENLAASNYDKYLPTRLKESFDENGNVNWDAMFNKTLTAGAEMGVLLTGTGMLSRAGRFLPKASVRVRNAAAMTSVSFVQQHQRNFMTAKENGFTDMEASAYALPLTAVTSILELVSPNELIAGKMNPSKYVGEYAIKRMASGLTKKEAIKEGALAWLKEVGAENVQEIMQGISEALANKIANSIIGKDLFHDTFDFQEFKETVIVTTMLTGGLAGGRVASRKRNSDPLRSASILEAVNNIEKTKATVSDMLRNNKISEEQGKTILSNLEESDKIVSGMPKELTDNQKIGIYGLVNEKRELIEENKKSYVDPLFKEKDSKILQEKVDKINAKIEAVINPSKDAVQEQQAKEGVLRPEEKESVQQVGLQEVGQNVQEREAKLEREGISVESAFDEDGDVDFEAENDVGEIAKKRDLGITRDREIAFVARNKEGEVIGGAYTAYDNSTGTYTFDVVVDESAEGTGLGSSLLSKVKDIPFEIQDMNPDAKVEVDVVNPQMQSMLEKQGFEVVKKLGPERVLMSPKESVPLMGQEVDDAAPSYAGTASILITPATVRSFDSTTERLKGLSLSFDKKTKEFDKEKSKRKRNKIFKELKEIEKQILDDARKEIISAVEKIDGVAVEFEDNALGLWDGGFEPSFTMNMLIAPDANTQEASNVLFDFAEKYSQDAFIVEQNSEEYNSDYQQGKIEAPLSVDDGKDLHYPQINITFDKELTPKEKAKMSNSLQENGVSSFSLTPTGLKVSIITHLSEEQSQLSLEQQKEIKIKDYEQITEGVTKSKTDVFGNDKGLESEIIIKRSSYNGATNEYTEDQTRQYDRGDVLKRFSRQEKEVEEAAVKAAKLRKKQISLQEQGKDLSKAEIRKMNELNKVSLPALLSTFKANQSRYKQAKVEVEAIAEKATEGTDATLSPFGIKRPERASVKTQRYYSGRNQDLGDGARVNIVVKNSSDVKKIFEKLDKDNPRNNESLRRLIEITDLGFPKTLVEVRTPNGMIAEIQVITEAAYLAKDGVNGFTGDQSQKKSAKKKLQEIRKRLGWNIPDGLGHYFYEIQRDVNINQELRDKAEALSKKYYGAFSGQNLSEDFMQDAKSFMQEVDASDKKSWDKGNKGIAPKSLSEYSVPLMGQDTQFQLNSSQKQRLEKASTKATNARTRINNSKKITKAQKKKEIDKINKELKEKRSEIIDEFVDLQDKSDKVLADTIEKVGEENLAQDPFETVPPPTEEAIKIEVKNPPKNLKRIKLKEIIGKKINLLMADRLKVELTDPSKPFNPETNPYKTMGGPFFPFIESLRDKIAWASIDLKAAKGNVRGAMKSDSSVVYNMKIDAVDSNRVIGDTIVEVLTEEQQAEAFTLIQAVTKKLDNKHVKKRPKGKFNIKEIVAKSKTLKEMFETIADPESGIDVDSKASFTKSILPTKTVSKQETELGKFFSEEGIYIEDLRNSITEEFALSMPSGTMTTVLEFTNKDGKTVKELYEEGVSEEEIFKQVIVTQEQAKAEGFPLHPNYPFYMRGRVKGLLEETTPFWNVIADPESTSSLTTIEKKVAGVTRSAQKDKPLPKLTKKQSKVQAAIAEVIDMKSKNKAKDKIEKILAFLKRNKDALDPKTNALIVSKLNEFKNSDKAKSSINYLLKEAIAPLVETDSESNKQAESISLRATSMTASVAKETRGILVSNYKKFLAILSRSFPSVEVVSSQAEFDKLVGRLKSGPKVLVNKNQEIYGAVSEGKIYLNPSQKNFNTPIHEFGHVWLNVAKNSSKELYNKGIELIQSEGKSYIEQVENSSAYKKIIKEMKDRGVSEAEIKAYILEEALATAIGDKGASFVTAVAKNKWEGWIDALYGLMKRLTGISKYTAKELQNISLDEFLQAVSVDLLSGEQLFEGVEVSLSDDVQLMTDNGQIADIINNSRKKELTDSEIRAALLGKGYDAALIDSLLGSQLDIFTESPAVFSEVEGAKGPQLFSEVKEKVVKYQTKRGGVKRNLSEVREKAMAYMRENPIFKKQTEAVQNELLVAFDETLGIESNESVELEIARLKNIVRPKEDIKSIKKRLNKVVRSIAVPGKLKVGPQIKQLTTILNKLNEKNYIETIQKASEIINTIQEKQLTEKQKSNERLKAAKAAADVRLDNLKEELKNQKKKFKAAKADAKKLNAAKVMLQSLINRALPKGEKVPVSAVNRLMTRIKNVKSPIDFFAEANKAIEFIKNERAKIKATRINEIKKFIDKAAQKQATKQGKSRTKKSVDSFGNQFFIDNKTLIEAIANKDWSTVERIKNEINGLQNEISEIETKLYNGEEISLAEEVLLNRRDGLNLLGNIENMSLEEVNDVFQQLKELKSESARNLKTKREAERNENREINRQAKESVKKSMPFLFETDGPARATITVDGDVVNVTFFNEEGEVTKRYEDVGRLSDRIDNLEVKGPEDFDALIKEYKENYNKAKEEGNKDRQEYYLEGINYYEAKKKEVDKETVSPFEQEILLQGIEKQKALSRDGVLTEEEAIRMEELQGKEKLTKNEAAELRALQAIEKASQDEEVQNETTRVLNRQEREGKINEISEDLKKLKVFSSLKKLLQRYKGMDSKGLISYFKNRLTTLETLTNILDRTGTFFRENIYDAINVMEEARLSNTQKQAKILDGIARSVGAKSVKRIQRKVNKVKPRKFGTKKYLLTGSDMMRIVALSRNDVQMKKLERMGITEMDIADMEALIGEQATEFTDAIVSYLSSTYFESINKVYRETFDINMNFIENYFPTKTVSESPVEVDFIESGNFGAVFEADMASALKNRTDISQDIEMNVGGFFTTLDTHVESMERFKAYAKGTKKLQNLFRSKSVNAIIEATNMKTLIKQLIALSINPEAIPSKQHNIINGLQTAFTGYALAFKNIQILKQATSFIQAMPYFTVQPNNKVKVPGIDLIAFSLRHAATMARLMSPAKTGPFANPIYKAAKISAGFSDRMKRGFSGDLETLVSGIIESKKPKNWWRRSWARKALRISAATPTVLGDMLGVLGYMTVYEQNIRNGMSPEQALKEFNNYNATQQTRRGSDKVAFQQPGITNEFSRVFGAFGSSLYAQVNKVMQSSTNIARDIRDLKAPKKKEVNELIVNYAVANVFFVLAANILKLTKGDDEDKEAVEASLKEAALGMNQLYKLPFIGAAIEGTYKSAVGERAFMSEITNPFTAIYKDVMKGWKKKDEYDLERSIEEKAFGTFGTLLELKMGMQFDTPIAIGKALGGDFSDDNVAGVLGITPWYRPEAPEEYIPPPRKKTPVQKRMEKAKKGGVSVKDRMKKAAKKKRGKG